MESTLEKVGSGSLIRNYAYLVAVIGAILMIIGLFLPWTYKYKVTYGGQSEIKNGAVVASLVYPKLWHVADAKGQITVESEINERKGK